MMMGPNNSGTNGGQHHDCPSRLAISDHAWLAAGLGMRGDNFFDEYRFGAGDVFDGLPRNRIGKEADEIARMSGLHRNADFTVGFEAANTRTVPGARVYDDERPQFRIDLNACRRSDAHKKIIHRPFKRAAIDDQFRFIVEHVWSSFGQVFAVLIAALTHHVPKQNAALGGIDHVLHRRRKHAKRRDVQFLGG